MTTWQRRRLMWAVAIVVAGIVGSILLPSTVAPGQFSCLQSVGADCPPHNHHEALRLLIRLMGLAIATILMLWPPRSAQEKRPSTI